MNGGWLEKGYYYYEGERPWVSAVQVPRRPSEDHVWDGAAWQDNVLGLYYYDKPNFVWAKKPDSELSAETIKARTLAENMVLIKFAKIILMEFDAIRASQPRPPAVVDFINKVKSYL